MKSYQSQEEKNYFADLKKRIAKAFPHSGTVEDNLKPGDRVYRFNAECYKDTDNAILIWHDIWLAKLIYKKGETPYIMKEYHMKKLSVLFARWDAG